MTGYPSTNRRYDFDWLRVIGAVLVVVAHCASTFNPWTPTFGNFQGFGLAQKSKLFGELLWNLNLWLMPLFMLLAGASVWYTLAKRTNRQYLRERLAHVGLPFAILTLGFAVPAAYVTCLMAGQFGGSLFEFYLHFFDGILPNGNFALFHLWFLLYLFLYALLTLPLFRFLQSDRGHAWIDRLARLCLRPGGLYIFALPLLVVQLSLTALSPPPLFPALVNDWTRFALLLLVFIFGYILTSDERFQAAIARQWRLALVVALATFAVLFAIAWPDTFNAYRDLPLDYSGSYLAFWTLFVLSSWSWLIAWLGFGQRFLRSNHPLLRVGCEVSFPLYLLHPLLWLPGVLLVMQWQAAALPAFLVLTAAVLGGTFALIALLKRWSVARLLLGLKARPAQAKPSYGPLPGDLSLIRE